MSVFSYSPEPASFFLFRDSGVFPGFSSTPGEKAFSGGGATLLFLLCLPAATMEEKRRGEEKIEVRR